MAGCRPAGSALRMRPQLLPRTQMQVVLMPALARRPTPRSMLLLTPLMVPSQRQCRQLMPHP